MEGHLFYWQELNMSSELKMKSKVKNSDGVISRALGKELSDWGFVLGKQVAFSVCILQ